MNSVEEAENSTAEMQTAGEQTPEANNDMNPLTTEETKAEKAPETEERQSLAEKAGEQEETPSVPEAYDFTKSIPEGEELDETTTKEFADICKTIGLSNEEANQVASYGFGWAQKLMNQVAEAREKEIDEWATATKKELGANFDKTMNEYGRGLSYIEKTSPNIRNILNQTGAGNCIEVVKAIAELGRLVSEDPGVGGGNAGKTGGAALYPNTHFENY